MDINVNIRGEIHLPEIAMLCQTISVRPIPEAAQPAAAPAPVAAPSPSPAVAQAPAAPSPAPVAPAPTPAIPSPAPAPAVPTGAPTYSIDDIARAGAALASCSRSVFRP